MHPYLLPLIISTTIATILAILGWRRRSTPGALPFTLMMLAVAWWSLAYTMQLSSTDLSAKIFWANLSYLGGLATPTVWLGFAIQYTGRGKWLIRRNLTLLAIEPIVILLLAWTNELHGLFRSNIQLDASGSFPMLSVTFGVAFWINTAYSYLLLLLGTILILDAFFHSPHLYRGQTGTILLGALVFWVANAVQLFGLNPFPHLALPPLAFTLTGMIMAWGLFRFRLLDIVPVARNAVIEGMSDGIIVLDVQNRIVDLNPAAREIIGNPTMRRLGQPITQILSGQSEGKTGTLSSTQTLIEFLNQDDYNVSERQTEIVLGKDGIRRFYELRITSLTGQHEQITGWLIVLRDITARTQAEEAMKLARDQALKASRLKTELLANVSHDLRTPLNAIRGFADMLKSEGYGPLSDKQSNAIERIISNTRQLSDLINDLLDAAQIEAGELTLKVSPFASEKLAKDVTSTMELQAQNKGLTLEIKVADNMPNILFGDRQRIRQILTNLVSNAIKFTDQGNVQIRLDCPDETYWTIQVSDTGRGIPSDAQDYIFDPFRQVDGSPTREHSGVGLGLSLVKQLVTLMNGRITLESQVGQGSTFTIALPLIRIKEEQS